MAAFPSALGCALAAAGHMQGATAFDQHLSRCAFAQYTCASFPHATAACWTALDADWNDDVISWFPASKAHVCLPVRARAVEWLPQGLGWGLPSCRAAARAVHQPQGFLTKCCFCIRRVRPKAESLRYVRRRRPETAHQPYHPPVLTNL